MRGWLLLLLSVTAIVAAVLGFHALKRRGADDLLPVIPERSQLDTVAVWYGADGDLEVVVKRFYADPERARFNDRVWNENLGRLDDPLRFDMMWLLNHGETPRRLPGGGPSGLRVPGRASWRVVPVESLIGADVVPEYFVPIVRSHAPIGLTHVEPGRLLRLAVAAPPAPPLAELPALVLEGEAEIVLRPGRIRRVDLSRYEKRPRGRLGPLVAYDGVDPAPVPHERAESGR